MTKNTETTKKTTKKKDLSAIYDKLKSYRPNEAVAILKKINHSKFDPSVEVHIRLGINPKKSTAFS